MINFAYYAGYFLIHVAEIAIGAHIGIISAAEILSKVANYAASLPESRD